MAFTVIFTLTSAGTDTGPFNISGTTNTGTVSLIASAVSKSTLLAGYQVTINDDNITGGTVASTGTCTNTQPWLTPDPGATPTPTATPTGTGTPTATIYTYYLTNFLSKDDNDSSGNPDYYDFCVDPGQTTGTVVYSTAPTISLLTDTTLYNENTLTTTFASLGTNGYYAVAASSGVNTFVVGPTGYRLLEVTTSGYINSVTLQDCSGGGGGGGGIE